MSDYTLVLIDTTGIQSYIFGSNRLRENVGASHLVHLATEGWLRDAPKSLLGMAKHNLQDREVIDTLCIGNDIDTELLYAGGGNTALLFRDDELAKQFTRNLSRKLLEEAPGLDVVAVRQPVDWNGSLAKAMSDGLEQLKQRKAKRERSHPLLGLGVTAACQSTGLVASFEKSEPGEPQLGVEQRQLLISAEVLAKWNNNTPAKERLRRELLPTLSKEFDFPSDFDDLGRSKGDFSYLAVVHADGNGMGKLLEQITKNYIERNGDEANRAYIQEVRAFSTGVNNAGRNALSLVVRKVAGWNERGWLETGSTYDPEQKRRVQALSIRPIVFGGDDVTFVCDGRIGLKAAQIFLEEFSKQKIPTPQGGMQDGVAAAGVSIVKVHYPFARAYQLSEALCKNAKNTSRDVSMLDWHLAQSGLFGDLGEIRRREYDERRDEQGKVKESLLMRPIAIGNSEKNDWRTWENFTKLLEIFKDTQATEPWSRNKVMQLREALRQGTDAVGAFIANYRELPAVKGTNEQTKNTGKDGGYSVYFDAIEMIEQEVWQ